jgi:uncharacterized membrane protein
LTAGSPAVRKRPHPLRRVHLALAARPRLLISVLCAVVAHFLLPAGVAATTHLLLVWNVGVLVYIGLALQLFLTEGPEDMDAHAERQQEGEWTIFWLTVGAVIFSFVAIFGEFASIKSLEGEAKGLHVGLVAVTLFLSWLMTHTSFAIRYAHEYYARDLGGTEIDRGLRFPGDEMPDYFDFFYFALVLGMTFQVSDVQITARKLRRMATAHGLLGFLFNTIILALTVNIAAGLL